MSNDKLKELYDAGFPGIVVTRNHNFVQTEEGDQEVYTCTICGEVRKWQNWGTAVVTPVDDFHHNCPKAESVYSEPSLESLIEACGEDFDSMYLDGDGSWLAEGSLVEYSGGRLIRSSGEGKTHKEAVANLFLELKKV